MNSVHRVRPILDVNINVTASVLGRAYAIANGLAADPVRFPAPVPPLPIFQAQIAKTEVAEQAAGRRTTGAAAARNVERMVLVGMLETECGYVQTICDANPESAIAIAEAAGLPVAESPTRNEPLLKVTAGTVSGTVLLDANATALTGGSGKSKFFNWQYTTDGGKSFINAPATPHGKTTIANLPPLTMVGFRVSVTYIEGPAEWSPIVAMLVQ